MKSIYSAESFFVSDSIADRVSMDHLEESNSKIDQFFCLIESQEDQIQSQMISISLDREHKNIIYKIEMLSTFKNVNKLFKLKKISKLIIKNNDNLLIKHAGDVNLMKIKVIPSSTGIHNVSLTISVSKS